MLDVTAIKAKIISLKNEVISDSISPLRLGVILEELLDLLGVVYRGSLSQDIQDVVQNAETALAKANLALQLLENAINLHLQASRVTIVDRGPYDPNARFFFETLNPDTGILETSDVWSHSCRYRCLVTDTKQAPTWDATDWMFIEGNPDFSVEFEPVNTIFRVSNIDMTLKIVAWMHNVDITADILDADVVWTRYSEDADGNPRPNSDNIWAVNHAGAGKSVHITTADIDYDGRTPKKVRFIATVTLRDNSAVAALNVIEIK